jgi:hypothetical protein
MIKLHYDNHTGYIHYKMITSRRDTPKPITTAPAHPQSGPVVPPTHMMYIPTLQQDQTAPDMTPSSFIQPDHEQNPAHTPNSFACTHSVIYHTINEWNNNRASQGHPFKATWHRLKYHGLTQHTPWERIQQLLKCNTYEEYITSVIQCPAVSSTYDLTWDQQQKI